MNHRLTRRQGSGDGNPNDSHHGTFFPVLTTSRQYARFPVYNTMNNEDWNGSLNLQPLSKVTLRSEAHALRLASASDLWYSGGGAFQPKTFGYTGRPRNDLRDLGSVWDISADYPATKSFSTTFYYAHAWGKSVIATIYPNDANSQRISWRRSIVSETGDGPIPSANIIGLLTHGVRKCDRDHILM